MWEDLKVYRQLDKKDINPTFKEFGKLIVSRLDSYSLNQTTSTIKIFREKNQLEQSIFIEKDKGSYNLRVSTCIKPIDFYQKHRFTMINIVSLGDIIGNHRKTNYPLTAEWQELAKQLTSRIQNEIEIYFLKYDSYEKIIKRRKEIEPKNYGLDNKFELLIYAALKTKDQKLLIKYLEKKIARPVMRIGLSEYLKSGKNGTGEKELLTKMKELAQNKDFDQIEKEITAYNNS